MTPNDGPGYEPELDASLTKVVKLPENGYEPVLETTVNARVSLAPGGNDALPVAL